jgi:hypothetical protein
MKREGRHPIWSWVIHTPWVVATLAILSLIVFFGSGAGNPLIRRVLVRRLETITGGRVELRTLSIQWLSLGVTLNGLVIHGSEPAGTEALLAAEEVHVGLRIDSFWGRKISLNELFLRQPEVHLRVARDGSSNVPLLHLPATPNKSLGATLFAMHVHRVNIADGWVLYNDVRKPLAVEGGDLQFVLEGSGTAERPVYLGTFDWKAFQFTANSFFPIPVNLAAKFTLSREGFTVEQCVLNAMRSHLDAQAEMQDFADPKWSFRYRGWVNLLDLRQALRSPETPTGRADVRGEATYAAGTFRGTGNYSGQDIALTYLPYFHASGVSSRGSFRMDNKGLVVPDFLAEAFGGTVKGKVTLRFDGLLFRGDTHIDGMRLAQVFPSIEETGFPVNELHWDSVLSADSVETWSGGFEHFVISAKIQWSSPEDIAAGHIPVDGQWQIRYRYDPQALDINYGEFETPSSRGSFVGVYSPLNTALDVKF